MLVARKITFQPRKWLNKGEIENMKVIESETHIYRMAKQMKQENKDIFSEKCMRDERVF